MQAYEKYSDISVIDVIFIIRLSIHVIIVLGTGTTNCSNAILILAMRWV